MSLLDNLLKADVEKITEKPQKKHEIKRLSQKMDTKFELELIALKPERYAEIQRMSVEIGKKGGIRDVNIFDPKILTLIDGIKEPNLKDKKLLDHFNVPTPKELILKLFLSGEIDDIKNEVDILSGYEKDEEEVDEEIKN